MKKEFTHTSGQYFASGETPLYYEECGVQDMPALLFLHGGFGSIEDLNPLLPFFADHHRIIGLDTRGHGKSYLGKEKLTYERLQRDVENLAGFLELDRLSVVGFSDGGITAYRLAALSDIHIEKVVTIGAKWSHADTYLMKQICRQMTADSCREMFADNYKSYLELNPVPRFDTFARKVLDMWQDGREDGMPDERISDIKVPVLAIRGDNDPLFSLKSATGLASHVENLKFLNVPFAGHEAFKDQLATGAYFMREFLQGIFS